jgi:hypothetical protein
MDKMQELEKVLENTNECFLQKSLRLLLRIKLSTKKLFFV